MKKIYFISGYVAVVLEEEFTIKKVIKKSKELPGDGDIFVLSPRKDRYRQILK
ncbi:MAG: hypothetical protein ACOC2J_00355 [bacterium]